MVRDFATGGSTDLAGPGDPPTADTSGRLVGGSTDLAGSGDPPTAGTFGGLVLPGSVLSRVVGTRKLAAI